VDVSRETLDCTVGLDAPGEVNLEKALRLADRLGGHLVTGHVDGVGEVLKFERIGESHELVIRAPKPLAKYIARKGSITVNGVSLTVNRVDDDRLFHQPDPAHRGGDDAQAPAGRQPRSTSRSTSSPATSSAC
jgi:riboflavin synthase alpha subunit